VEIHPAGIPFFGAASFLRNFRHQIRFQILNRMKIYSLTNEAVIWQGATPVAGDASGRRGWAEGD